MEGWAEEAYTHILQEPQSPWEGFYSVKGVCYTPSDQESQHLGLLS